MIDTDDIEIPTTRRDLAQRVADRVSRYRREQWAAVLDVRPAPGWRQRMRELRKPAAK